MYTGISSKFTGPNAFASTVTGEYWEVMPKFDADMHRLQRGLIKHRLELEKKRNKIVKESGYLTDEQIETFKQLALT